MKLRYLPILLSMLILACEGYASPPKLVYRNSFDTSEDLNDWTMEGPGVAKIENGRLLIHSKWLPELEKLGDQVALIEPGGANYYPFIEQWVKEREPENLSKYILKPSTAKFIGGHTQYWNKQVHPDNFLIRLKFQPANPYPLHMVTFCARGLNGEDVLDPRLAPRFGLGGQYMSGDIRNYRISYSVQRPWRAARHRRFGVHSGRGRCVSYRRACLRAGVDHAADRPGRRGRAPGRPNAAPTSGDGGPVVRES